MTVSYTKSDIVSLEQYGGINFLIPNLRKRGNIKCILRSVVLLSNQKGAETSKRLAPFAKPPHFT